MVTTIRPARIEDAHGIARVHVDSWQTTYQGIIPDEYLAQRANTYEQIVQFWAKGLSNPESKSIVFVAVDESGRIVGFSAGGSERERDADYKGELYAIYLLKELQGQGVGSRLVRALVEKLVATGLSTMLVWVLTENPACKFYASLGGQHVRSKQIEIGGVSLQESGYGWQDIRELLNG